LASTWADQHTALPAIPQPPLLLLVLVLVLVLLLLLLLLCDG
jgi:hypothetical protein